MKYCKNAIIMVVISLLTLSTTISGVLAERQEKNVVKPINLSDPQPNIITGGNLAGWTADAAAHVSNVYNSLEALLAAIQERVGQIEDIEKAIKEAKSFLKEWRNTESWQVIKRLKILFSTDWQQIIDGINAAYEIISDWYDFFVTGDYPEIIKALNNLKMSCEEFYNWYNEKHWEDPISIYGQVLFIDGTGISGASVSCSEVTVSTDENGEFDFEIDVTTLDEESWMPHMCQIIVTYKEQTKQSEQIPVFSGGSLESTWIFTKTKDSAITITRISLKILEKLIYGVTSKFISSSKVFTTPNTEPTTNTNPSTTSGSRLIIPPTPSTTTNPTVTNPVITKLFETISNQMNDIQSENNEVNSIDNMDHQARNKTSEEFTQRSSVKDLLNIPNNNEVQNY